MLRGAAGWFVRRWLVKRAILIAVGLGMVVGLVFGAMFFWLLPQWIGFGLTIVVWGTTAVGLVIAILLGWNIENLRKGLDAEILVGQTIERAIIAENCAIAHSVKEIAKVGDIDHIVATPKAVCVIETKYKKVPDFAKVLDCIAANMDAVRQWADGLAPDKETTVRGCLVLAFEDQIVKKHRWGHNSNGGKESINVYSRPSLAEFEKEIREEIKKPQSLDERIKEEIWKLAEIETKTCPD